MSGERYTGKTESEPSHHFELTEAKDEIRRLSAQLTLAREALERLYDLAQVGILVAATQFDGSIEWQNRKKITTVLEKVTSALSFLK